MLAMTHPPYLLHKKPTKPLHFCRWFCHHAPLVATILPLRATPLNATKLALTFMTISQITANLRSQKHLHVILSRLSSQNTPSQTMWYQRASIVRRWSQGQKNLKEESCLNCRIYFTTIIERCENTVVVHWLGLGNKRQEGARCRRKHPDSSQNNQIQCKITLWHWSTQEAILWHYVGNDCNLQQHAEWQFFWHLANVIHWPWEIRAKPFLWCVSLWFAIVLRPC